jgi:hypothetical protein
MPFAFAPLFPTPLQALNMQNSADKKMMPDAKIIIHA